MIVIAFDPGGTTGYCVGILETDTHQMRITQHQEKINHKQLYDLLFVSRPDHIVCEQFDYRNKARKGLELISKEYIGVIELFVQQIQNCILHYQSPSILAGHFTDRRLRDLGLWQPGQPHAMDATRHFMNWYDFGYGYQFNNKLGVEAT